jgi:hypothetical protein
VLQRLRDNSAAFKVFWNSLDSRKKAQLVREKSDAILKVRAGSRAANRRHGGLAGV